MVRAPKQRIAHRARVLLVLAAGAVMDALASQAQAQFIDPACDTSNNPVTISSNCENFQLNTSKSAVTIGPSARVSAFASQSDGVLINPGGSVTGTFLNQGRITFGIENNAMVNRGTISTLINQNQIIGRQDGLHNRGTISTLVNRGSILTDGLDSNFGALDNAGEIGILENSGTISATGGISGNGPHAIRQSGHIGTLLNTGLISAQNNAIHFVPAINSRIDTLFNAGTIQGGIAGAGISTFASAIQLGPGSSIGELINIGTIDHSVCLPDGTCFAAIDNDGGSIDTITNFGTLSSGNTGTSGFGIRNGVTGRIGTLNNDQNNLKYYGTLPANYLNIIYGLSTYGSLAVTNGSGVMSFGIDAVAPIGQSTYANVLSGVSAGNLSTTSGTWGGGLFNNTWVLNPVTPTQWDLQITSAAIVPSVETSAGNTLANAIIQTVSTPGAAGVTPGVLVPTLVNGVTLQQAAQSLTPAQTNQLSTVSAQGYSSNLTIGLQQMGSISDSVMARSQAPLSTDGEGQAGAVEIDHGRYIWVDGSASTGTVDSYDGLSGFDYDLYDLTFGADLRRDETGSFGVFAGTGYSDMTESADVPESFDTTSYFVGLYGTRDLAADAELSATLGYIYNDNSASRDNASFGDFTGGTAESDYSSYGFYGAVKVSKPMATTNPTKVTPFLGASLSKLWMNEANETGGGDFNYTIDETSAYSGILFAGSDFSMPVSGGQGSEMSLIGFFQLGYDVFADDDSAHSVTATSATFGSFDQVGANMGPVQAMIGLGVEGDLARGVYARLGAVGSFNTNGYQVGLGGELRW
jgi:hypothetical protein